MKQKLNSIKDALKYFFLELVDCRSSRIQLIWGTFFAWSIGIIYYGVFVPLVREISIIFYRQNCIIANPINLDSKEYGVTILSMLGTAFMAIVVAYVVSKQYENKVSMNNIMKKENNKTQNDEEK